MRGDVQAGPEDYFRKSITVSFLDNTLNEMKVHRATRQNCFRTTVGSIYYWKYCSKNEPPAPSSFKRVSGSAPVSVHGEDVFKKNIARTKFDKCYIFWHFDEELYL